MLRIAVWVFGAVVSNWLYSAALASTDFEIPNDMPRKLLLTASAAAAAMVGGSFAILVYDRVRKW